MPQPDKRSVLQVLTKARLRELVDVFELKLAAAESKDAHVDLLARSKKATLPKLLDQLQRDELADLCRAHGHPHSGEKAVLVARLLGQPTPTEPDDPAEPDRTPEPPARTRTASPPAPMSLIRFGNESITLSCRFPSTPTP